MITVVLAGMALALCLGGWIGVVLAERNRAANDDLAAVVLSQRFVTPLKNVDTADMLTAFEAERDALEPNELWAMAKTQTPADTSRPRTSPPMRARRTPPTGVGGPHLPTQPRRSK